MRPMNTPADDEDQMRYLENWRREQEEKRAKKDKNKCRKNGDRSKGTKAFMKFLHLGE